MTSQHCGAQWSEVVDIVSTNPPPNMDRSGEGLGDGRTSPIKVGGSLVKGPYSPCRSWLPTELAKIGK